MAAGPPPPPPPPPPPVQAASPGSAAPSAAGVAAVFADLNRGEEVTKGLRKVDKSEMTHKNPSLRAGNTVPATAPVARKHRKITATPLTTTLYSGQETDQALETTSFSR